MNIGDKNKNVLINHLLVIVKFKFSKFIIKEVDFHDSLWYRILQVSIDNVKI